MNCWGSNDRVRAVICLGALVCGVGIALAADTYSLAKGAGAPPAELPAALRDAVGADGMEVKGTGGVLCDLWLRKVVPLAATPSQELGVTFGQIAEGTLLGVMRVAADTTDFRNQKVKAGLYTLRYAWAPVDGNHTGIAPQRDFALLSPVAVDADPATILRDEALKRSAKTTGTKHPSVWSLWPGDDSATGPALHYQDDSECWLLTFRLALAGGKKLSMGMIVAGHAPEA
jgi:hypothetical protein